MQVHAEEEVYRKPLKGPRITKKPGFYAQGLEQEITLILANMILEERIDNVSA